MTEISHSLQEQICSRARVYGKDTSRCPNLPFRPIMTWHMGRGCQRREGGLYSHLIPQGSSHQLELT